MKAVARTLLNLLAVAGVIWSGLIIRYTDNEDLFPFVLAFAMALTLACLSRLVSEVQRLRGKEPLPKTFTQLLWWAVVVLLVVVGVKDFQVMLA